MPNISSYADGMQLIHWPRQPTIEVSVADYTAIILTPAREKEEHEK